MPTTCCEKGPLPPLFEPAALFEPAVLPPLLEPAALFEPALALPATLPAPLVPGEPSPLLSEHAEMPLASAAQSTGPAILPKSREIVICLPVSSVGGRVSGKPIKARSKKSPFTWRFGAKSYARKGSRLSSTAATLRGVTLPVGTSGARSPRCVLIVEDDDDSREMLGELVASFGHRPLSAANAAEALAHAREQKPDVALIDIGLPEVDGCELARLLRVVISETPGLHTRLVALTGYSDGSMRESAGAAGFDAYVVKPIMPAALEALLGA